MKADEIYFSICALLLLFSSCNNFTYYERTKEYYFASYSDDDAISNYYRYEVNLKQRKDSLFRCFKISNYDNKFNLKDSTARVELLLSNVLYEKRLNPESNEREFIPSFILNKDTCLHVEYPEPLNDVLSFKSCYKQTSKLTLSGKSFGNVHVFERFRGKGHVIKSRVYYSRDFILLKEEYAEGYSPNFKVIRLLNPPSQIKRKQSE